MTQTQSTGWQLTLTHPTTGRTVSLDVLDQPQFDPSLNSLVNARIPVRRSEDLLEWPSDTTVDLTLDGRDQPVDVVVDIEQQSDRTIIVAEGGVELDNRVRTEYQEERRHIAATEIINNETPYTADVDTHVFVGQENVTLQSADTTQELSDLIDIQPKDPIKIENGVVETTQTGFVEEAENTSPSAASTITRSDFSGGEGVVFNSSINDISITIDLKHDTDNLRLAYRGVNTSGNDEFIAINLLDSNGDPVAGGEAPPSSLGWYTDNISGSYAAGEHFFELKPDPNVISGSAEIDVLAIVDGDYYDTSSLDNILNEPNGYLDDPATKPDAVDVVVDDATSAFVITEATGDIMIDDTSNDQAVALSADRGQTYTESTNSTTVTATGLETPQVRLRVTLSRHSPQGPRDQTPRLGYASQKLDATEVLADLRQESLLIDQTYDDSVESVLNQIAGDEYIWSYRLENGTPTVAWSQPGQRTADSDPDIDADVSVTKNLKTWDAVTIKGSAQTVSGERFSGSTTLQALDRDNIVPGSESVGEIDGDTEFTRSEDYEMRYNPGEIRILDSGDMSSGTDYEINYRYEVEGTYPSDYAGSNELVETISGVVSDRQAQQLAYIILEVDPAVKFESYSAQVTLPRGGSLFDPLEALSLEQLQLPDEATPIEIREPPQRTPQGIQLRLGAQDPLASLSRLSKQLQSVSRRS